MRFADRVNLNNCKIEGEQLSNGKVFKYTKTQYIINGL